MDEPIINEADAGDMDADLESIAIIGWSGRLPGAQDIDSFWEIIRDGKESIDFYSEEELREAGVPEFALRDPNFVRALKGQSVRKKKQRKVCFVDFGITRDFAREHS